MPTRKTTTTAKSTANKEPARVRKATPARAKTSSVILQARVDGNFAEELLAHDAAVLGLDGPSEVVREGLKLIHRRAQEQSLIDSYEAYYQGRRAPLPAGVADEDAD